MLPTFTTYGTPSVFNPRRKSITVGVAADSPATPSFQKGDAATPSVEGDTPSLLRRIRSPPVSPSGLSGRMSSRNVALVATIFACVLVSTSYWAFLSRNHEQEELSALSALVREQQAEMHELSSTIEKQEGSIATLAAATRSQTAETSLLRTRLHDTENELQQTSAKLSTALHLEGKPTAAKDVSALVSVRFVFDADPRLGPEVQLFWLSGNSTEQLYTTLPAGKQADERTYPGQCASRRLEPAARRRAAPLLCTAGAWFRHPGWRARDPRTGNHLLSYCATEDKEQAVHILPHQDVLVDFHFPKTAKMAQRVRVLAVGPPQTLVGEIAQGGHLSTPTRAGTRFQVVEATAAARPLLEVTASFEEEQHVDIGTNVSLEVALPRRATSAVQLFWLWGGAEAFAKEHLHATIQPGDSVRVATLAGEQWVAKDKASGRVLRALTTTDEAEQRIELVPPPPATKVHARFLSIPERR